MDENHAPLRDVAAVSHYFSLLEEFFAVEPLQ
jgi:hypothetical protein